MPPSADPTTAAEAAPATAPTPATLQFPIVGGTIAPTPPKGRCRPAAARW